MATKTLSATIDLKTADKVIGIFGLDSIIAQSLSYDDTVVSSATTTITHAAPVQLVAKVAGTKVVYVWIKNTDATNFVVLKNDDADVWGKLLPGEWAFFPVALASGFEVQADTGDCICEYAIFQTP